METLTQRWDAVEKQIRELRPNLRDSDIARMRTMWVCGFMNALGDFSLMKPEDRAMLAMEGHLLNSGI